MPTSGKSDQLLPNESLLTGCANTSKKKRNANFIDPNKPNTGVKLPACSLKPLNLDLSLSKRISIAGRPHSPAVTNQRLSLEAEGLFPSNPH